MKNNECKYCFRPTKGKRVTCDVLECKHERARLASARWYAKHRHKLLKRKATAYVTTS